MVRYHRLLLREEKGMTSREYIYSRYGQYNTFVSIKLIPDCDSYNKYGSTIYGTFRYTMDEREELEAAIQQDPMPATYGNVLFELSPVTKGLTEDWKKELDRSGFPIADIDSIMSLPLPQKNAFREKGIKTIQNRIPIEIDFTVRQALECYLGMYQRQLSSGWVRHIWQWVEIAALISYLHPEDVEGDIKKICEDPRLKHAVRHKFLQYKRDDIGLTDEEQEEELYLSLCRVKKRLSFATKEVQRSGIKYRDLPDALKSAYFNFMMKFEPRSISMGDPIIWIGFERAFHIVARHANGLQAKGTFETKTPFQYDFKDLFDLIHVVIESQGDDIRAELRANPEKRVRRIGKRAIEYNGNHYRLEINGDGSIETFHPYN